MSKGLEALERVRNQRVFIDFEIDATVNDFCEKDLDIIETELKDNEDLKTQFAVNSMNEFFRTLDEQKKLKALEIIIEKDVSMYWLRHSKNVDEYNNFILTDKRQYQKLTQEEYDLLKEVLL